MSALSLVRQSVESHLASLTGVREAAPMIEASVAAIHRALASGGKVMTCGNGGSASQALHLAEEMMGRFARERPPLAAVCLSSDPTAITCIANDYGFEEVFARQVEGLGRPSDVLVVLSTSGQSANIVRALQRARAVGMTTIGLLGRAGSDAQRLCDVALTTPTMPAAHVQEIHLMAIHLILEGLEATA